MQLIEINTNPALLRHGQHLTTMLPRMLEETLQKALDPHFPAPPPPTAPASSNDASGDAASDASEEEAACAPPPARAPA